MNLGTLTSSNPLHDSESIYHGNSIEEYFTIPISEQITISLSLHASIDSVVWNADNSNGYVVYQWSYGNIFYTNGSMLPGLYHFNLYNFGPNAVDQLSVTITAGPPPAHVDPTVTVQNVQVAANTSIAASSMNIIISNPSGDTITQYGFWDGGTGGGHFTVNGIAQAAGQWIYVPTANLNTVQYVGGSSAGNETLYVDVYDATTSTWSAYSSLTATTFTPVTYSISPSPAAINENAGSATFTITRSDASQVSTVYVSTVHDQGTGNPNENYFYQGIRNIPLTFNAGVRSETISIKINDLHLTMGSETFRLIVQSPDVISLDPAATSPSLASDNFTIVNNDPSTTVHPNDIARSGAVTGPYNFIDLLNLQASYADLTNAFGTNQQAMQNWFNAREAVEQRPDTFDGLDYIASYGDLLNAFKGAGSIQAVRDTGARHYITNGHNEGRMTTFNGLDYIASYGDLIKAFGVNGDAGAYHYIENGVSEGRTTTFDGLDYIASYTDLIKAFGANEQAGAAHYIANGYNEGRTTTFDGLDYIAGYTDLMKAFGANNDAGASHFITGGFSEGRSAAPFNVSAYENAHPDLIGKYATNDAFLGAYINTYISTGNFLT